MAVSMDDLIADLRAETAVLDGILDRLDEAAWQLPTPAPDWSVSDQISHLAHADDSATLAVRDRAKFEAGRGAVVSDVNGFTARVAREHRDMPPAELRAWFARARNTMIDVYGALDPSTRVPWYGPDMSAAAQMTARIMETWAHGRDVADAVGVEWAVTPGLRQVAHISVRAIPNSFRANGRPVPDDPVRVELTTTAGDVWVWGPADAANRVTGDAVELCLVATQRRHPDDTSLVAEGPVATEWLTIAQAFAGPPGAGRAPAAK
jgi:uncharacterized protein (TIGR03084 family)